MESFTNVLKSILKLNFNFITLLCLTSILFFVSPKANAEQNFFTGFFSSTAIKGYDPVAYFNENKAVKGSSQFSYLWSGVNWNFSSEANLKLFKAEPSKYMPQYGGWCSYAMAEGTKVGVDPTAFDIKDGKLYLNYNKKVQKKWRKKPEKYIPKADKFWEKI
jgi:YHS domain-containing protein